MCDFWLPPEIDEVSIIRRQRLETELSRLFRSGFRLVGMEGRAGQGKTTLAAQYCQISRRPTLWYSLGVDDENPIVLAEQLFLALTENAPNGKTPEPLPSDSNINESFATDLGIWLAEKAPSYSAQPVLLILDDFHLINDSITATFLKSFIANSHNSLSFLITSRQGLPAFLSTVKGVSHVCLNDQQLGVTSNEAFSLITRIAGNFRRSKQTDQEIKKISGWTAGAVLTAHAFNNSDTTQLEIKTDSTLYFQELLANLSDEMQRKLMLLALRDGRFTTFWAEKISDTKNIDQVLHRMCRENRFVSHTADASGYFQLHHLFRDYLLNNFTKHYSPQEQVEIHLKAARIAVVDKEPERAIHHCFAANNPAEAQNVLRQTGLMLMAKNRVWPLGRLLNQVDEETLHTHPWLSLFKSIIKMNEDPSQGLNYLDYALKEFESKGELLEELLVLSQIIYANIYLY